MNVLTMGQLSKIYASQKGRIQIRVCQDFGPLKVLEMGKMLAVMTKLEMSVLTMTDWCLLLNKKIEHRRNAVLTKTQLFL